MKWHFKDLKISRGQDAPGHPYEVSRVRHSSALFKILPMALFSPSGAPEETRKKLKKTKQIH
jgi:hypothetical protein